MPFRVLIVDDSLIVRAAVGDIIGSIPDTEICGRAVNGAEAIEKIATLKPDLVILDIEMPVMDGMTVLRELKLRGMKIPVIMLSVLTQHGARTTFQALELGALDFIPKPSAQAGLQLSDIAGFLVEKVSGLVASRAEKAYAAVAPRPDRHSAEKLELLVIGSSTGGPQALHRIFRDFTEPFPAPILIVQHMPPVFTAAFAERLGQVGAVEVLEAADGMEIKPNRAILAPGNRHMVLKGGKISLNDEPTVRSHRPSVDYTLNRVVDEYGMRAAALIMTGMGQDGLEAVTRLYQAGGLTLAQDEASSVVFGMNRRAIEAGVIDRVLTLEESAAVLRSFF
ncbi:MAG TPA: chemotaxis-specific protein-glutamate methyltransferase CheB [Leptospiraceae bacterium]|nr:chemotaxis-specific protein-glutamate methyltransferase CheB [Leptospirales bacterium]HMW58880.1 chemotaxis-specific protein-glutamate methyltransferase CheB [Leptospiraceae bacterium]HMX55844.1 chemotaxis-specific protein-glutamate methyltransferase CheB [Leptospiraceae bacterium]HNJ36093.1 chemotaxis-specific protein-glutamate methyltransferase CheB [Leptospiraceae bacterium]HNL68773.1 chemotaxis-specific protein-glutamate methyltransferase CheB [Leptospiraceae bacterium]